MPNNHVAAPYLADVTHVGVASAQSHDSLISIACTLQQAVFRIHAILRQVRWMTQNELEHYKVKSTLYMCY